MSYPNVATAGVSGPMNATHALKQNLRERLMSVLGGLGEAHALIDSIEAALAPREMTAKGIQQSAPGPYPLEAEVEQLEVGVKALVERLRGIAADL